MQIQHHTFRYKSKKWAKFGTYFDISVMIYGISVIEYERLEYDGAKFFLLIECNPTVNKFSGFSEEIDRLSVVVPILGITAFATHIQIDGFFDA